MIQINRMKQIVQNQIESNNYINNFTEGDAEMRYSYLAKLPNNSDTWGFIRTLRTIATGKHIRVRVRGRHPDRKTLYNIIKKQYVP